MEGGGKILAYIGAVPTIVGMLYGGGSWVDGRYHHADDATTEYTEAMSHVYLVEMRLEQKIQTDRLADLDERIYRFEQRYGAQLNRDDDPQFETVRGEYRKLLQERKYLEQQMKILDERIMQNSAPQPNRRSP